MRLVVEQHKKSRRSERSEGERQNKEKNCQNVAYV